MTAYTKTTNFAAKDSLTIGDPNKIIKGTEHNVEYDNIATAVNSKANTSSPTITGTANFTNIASGALTGVTINNSVIGGATPAAGTFSTFTLASGATAVAILDEDTLSSNSATALVTQQSVKAYVDAQVVSANSFTGALAAGNTSGGNNVIISAGDVITTDTINETTAAAGVTVDGVLLKDGLVDGIDVSALVSATEANVKAAIDGATLSAVTVATDDKILIQDTSDADNLKTVTVQSVVDLTPPASQITATASGALSDGDPVITLTDGTVQAIAVSSPTTLTPTAVSGPSGVLTDSVNVVYDPESKKFLAIGRNTGTDLTVSVGKINESGDDVLWGAPVQAVSTGVTSSSACWDVAHSRLVIAYDQSSVGKAIVGIVDGLSISFGTAVTFDAAAVASTTICYDSLTEQVVIAFPDAGNSNYATAIVGAVSGNTISFGTAAVMASVASGDFSSCYDAGENKVLICYRDAAASNVGKAVVGTVAGTGITFGTPVATPSAAYWQFTRTVYDSANLKSVVIYNESGAGKAAVATIASTSVSFGTPATFETPGAYNFSSCAFDSVNEKIVVVYADGGNLSYQTAAIGTVAGTGITFGTPVVVRSIAVASGYTGVAFDPVTGVSLSVASRLTLQPVTSLIQTGETNLKNGSFIGFSSGAYSDTATATINTIGGKNIAQSGLTVGKKYYVNSAGQLNLSGPEYAGIALSATSILIKG